MLDWYDGGHSSRMKQTDTRTLSLPHVIHTTNKDSRDTKSICDTSSFTCYPVIESALSFEPAQHHIYIDRKNGAEADEWTDCSSYGK